MSISGWRNGPAKAKPAGKPKPPPPTPFEQTGMAGVTAGQLSAMQEANGTLIEQTKIASAGLTDEQRAKAAGLKTAAEAYNKVRKALGKLAKVE